MTEETGLTLYSMPSSGNSYKVRLLLSHLRRPCRHVEMEYETPALDRAHADGLLPFGKLPVLALPDGTRLAESNAILCFLADGTDWLPTDPVERAQTLSWMFWEQNQHEGVIAVRAAILTYAARAHLRTPDRLSDLFARGQAILARMDAALSSRDWIAGPRPTVADLCLFAYTHSAEAAGGFDLDPFPALRAWLDRVAALPDHIPLTETAR